MTLDLKLQQDYLFNHLIDCFLCSAYSYLMINQNAEVLTIVDNILLAESANKCAPQNIIALMLKCEACLGMKQVRMAEGIVEELENRFMEYEICKTPIIALKKHISEKITQQNGSNTFSIKP